MKKTGIFIITTLIIVNFSFSQQTFFTQVDDDTFHMPMDILIKQDGNMLFCSQFKLGNQSWNSMMIEVNHFGEIMNEWTFETNDDETMLCTRLMESDDHFYLFGEGNKNNKAHVSNIKFDLQFNEVDQYYYDINGLNPGKLFPLKVLCRDTTFHIVGLARCTNTFQPPFYLKTSHSGSYLHSSYYNPSPSYIELWPMDFYFSPGSDNLFTICQDWHCNNNSWAHFYEFDTTMSVVSHLPITTGNLGFIMLDYKIFRDSDSSFYLAHRYWDILNNGGWNSQVTRFDLNGNTLNDFIFQCEEDSASWLAHYNGMDTLPGGNLLMCATWNLTSGFGIQQEPTKIVLFKLSPTLDLIWQKYLFGEKGMYEAYAMKAHPDGGIVILGTHCPTPPTSTDVKEVFIMKTDSTGNITVGLDENKPRLKTTEAILYPNPASDFVNIEFSRVYHEAVFELMDIGGKVILQKQLYGNHQHINISSVPAGTYVYRIFNVDGLDERGKVVVRR